MKKKLSLFLILFVLAFVLVGCRKPHKHNYASNKVEATCTEKGYTEHTCECGDYYKDNYVDALGHSYGEWVVVKEATEEAEGLKERECSCGEKESEVIEKLPHTHKFGEWVVVKEATEEAAGLKERVCSCSEKEIEVIEKLPHTHKYGEWVVVKEATEEADGLKERVCSCSEKETEVIEKLPHTHKYGEWVVVKEATEEADGLKERECSCGEKETEVLPKIEHVHAWSEWKVLTEATLESEGLKERECSCGEKQTQVITKLPGDVVEPKYVYVGAGKEYTELDAAIAAVEDGTIIVLSAGEYSLSVIIDKNITIQGPNANLYAYDYHTNEAIINVAKDVAGNLKAANITFNGVHLVGTGGGAGIPGVFFQDGGGLENLTFKSCVVSDMNTFIKINGGTSSVNLLIEDCYIHTIGQFIVWAQSAQIKETILINNYVDGSTCGAVTNAAAALFRIRTGKLEAYANYFNGNSANTPGYFECSNLDSIVKYNTFNNVTAFVNSSAANKLVFDQNLYLNNGKALEKAPSTVAAGGAIADKVVAKSEEEVEELYLESLLNKQPIRYFRVQFDANGGTITSSYPAIYDLTVGIETLPTVELEGLVFAGWYLNGEKVESIPAGTEGDIKLVAKWAKDTLLVDGTGENGHYATIADALAAAKEGDVIELVAGEYTEDITINKANITIIGPNFGVNGNSSTREAEAIYKGVITITSTGKGLEIDGLAFTGGTKIKYDENVAYEGFTFKNNKVYDTTETTVAFNIDRYATPGFIQFTLASGGYVKNVMIFDNSFENVSEVNLLINRAINLSVEGNTFKDFDLDAIRIEGGYAYGVLAFTNNVFEQTTKEHGNNGIFLYSVAGTTGTNASVIIENNEFINIGSANGTNFTGAISGYRYQENPTSIEIRYNIFDHCYDYLYIRNNGAAGSAWSCVVENNQFLGLPHNQYYGSYVGTDTESTNPHTAVFGANYYEDNEGNVISDLSAYASYFKHLSTYGTALSAKPGDANVGVYEFWNITYDLKEGTTKDSLIYNYVTPIDEDIVLPVLTKPNYQFNGWLLDGEVITSISGNTRGDLHLIADFTLLEGEIYEIEYINGKENAIWPSRAADSREEIVEELLKDLYEWAQGNGETRSYEAYKEYIKAEIASYNNIKLRNKELKNYPAEDGSTEYFFNVPKYYQKWNEFFAIFNEAMLKVNSGQVFYTDDYAAMVRLHQFISWSSTGQSYFNSFLTRMCAATKVPAEIPTTYRGGQVVELPQLSMANGLKFLGWYDNPEFTGDAITTIKSTDSGNKKYYAKWDAEVLVERVEINKIEKLLLFQTHQLAWTIFPDNATNKEVEFFSSNEAVATVSAKGLITGLATGTTTITVKVYGNREADITFDIQVYVNDYIDASFESTSYVVKGETIQLNAVVHKPNKVDKVVWTSLTPEIATVSADGVVTGVKAGLAKIVAKDPENAELSLEFTVTVLDEDPSGVLDLILRSHESNIFYRYNLGIGAGVPEYYKDIFGSVNKILMNNALQIDTSRKDKEVEAGTGDYFTSMKSIEFITVHYTGNMSKGADAEANANYFIGDNAVSIHYTTGNDGVFQALDHAQGAYHAGDSGAYDQVGEFKWMPTGVKVGENDPKYPVFTISQDFYYEINGQKTSVAMPKPWNYSGRGTDHTLNADGTISSKSNFGQTGFTGRTPESFINDMGLPFTIVDGEYYMGTTWWCYTQVYEGRICSTGGNRNSIGIESCVDEGSDLWYTWQKTAQLVAQLMVETNLDITKVRGHHFFSGKDCPQPMLANDCEIWKEFVSLIEAEYELLTEYNGYTITFESHNPEIVDNTGRVVSQPDETTCVTYTVTITKDGQSQSITLSSIIPGLYVGR